MSSSSPNHGAPALAGVVGFFDEPSALTEATQKTREAKWQFFDAFSPYPIHGIEKAAGLKRSPLPYVTFFAGLTGFMCAVALQYWTSAVDWPLNVGGKPTWSWPAFVPIMFELTVLLAGLFTVAGMFALNRLPNVTKKAFDPRITRDRFAIMIEVPPFKADEDAEVIEKKTAGYKKFNEKDAADFLKSIGAKDVRSVQAEGWF